MRCKWTWIVRAVLFGMLMCALLCLGMGAAKAPDRGSHRELPPGFRRLMDASTAEESLTALHNLNINFTGEDSSLDLREQMDFLLTPALLVQEAVSDGVVLTYPEE